MIADLRSDTLTLPTAGMKQAMLNAPLGDDVFQEDPTTAELEHKLAALFGMEAGLFCPSGTMSNQIAIKAQTQPLDEIICDKLSHIYNYETGGWAFHSGVSIRLTSGERGKMTPEQAAECILPDFDWYPNSRMLCIENTVNKGGGSVYTLNEMQVLSSFCKENNLIYHLDGARIFNALAVLEIEAKLLGPLFDSVSVCLSKGLGTPAGSVLLGKKEMIRKARKIRKVMGGGMRQSGMLAAAGIYALENHLPDLRRDHENAQRIAQEIANVPGVRAVLPVETNIIIAETKDAHQLHQTLAESGIRCSPFSPTHIRLVTHRDLTDEQVEQVVRVLQQMSEK